MRAATVVAMTALALFSCHPAPTMLTPLGEQVTVVHTLPEVKDCEELGLVNAAASDLLGGEDSRLVNARNRAAALGGNRILPGRIEFTGVQEFRVFQCP